MKPKWSTVMLTCFVSFLFALVTLNHLIPKVYNAYREWQYAQSLAELRDKDGAFVLIGRSDSEDKSIGQIGYHHSNDGSEVFFIAYPPTCTSTRVITQGICVQLSMDHFIWDAETMEVVKRGDARYLCIARLFVGGVGVYTVQSCDANDGSRPDWTVPQSAQMLGT